MQVGGYLVHRKHGDRRLIVELRGDYVVTESHQVQGIMPISFYVDSPFWAYDGE